MVMYSFIIVILGGLLMATMCASEQTVEEPWVACWIDTCECSPNPTRELLFPGTHYNVEICFFGKILPDTFLFINDNSKKKYKLKEDKVTEINGSKWCTVVEEVENAERVKLEVVNVSNDAFLICRVEMVRMPVKQKKVERVVAPSSTDMNIELAVDVVEAIELQGTGGTGELRGIITYLPLSGSLYHDFAKTQPITTTPTNLTGLVVYYQSFLHVSVREQRDRFFFTIQDSDEVVSPYEGLVWIELSGVYVVRDVYLEVSAGETVDINVCDLPLMDYPRLDLWYTVFRDGPSNTQCFFTGDTSVQITDMNVVSGDSGRLFMGDVELTPDYFGWFCGYPANCEYRAPMDASVVEITFRFPIAWTSYSPSAVITIAVVETPAPMQITFNINADDWYGEIKGIIPLVCNFPFTVTQWELGDGELFAEESISQDDSPPYISHTSPGLSYFPAVGVKGRFVANVTVDANCGNFIWPFELSYNIHVPEAIEVADIGVDDAIAVEPFSNGNTLFHDPVDPNSPEPLRASFAFYYGDLYDICGYEYQVGSALLFDACDNFCNSTSNVFEINLGTFDGVTVYPAPRSPPSVIKVVNAPYSYVPFALDAAFHLADMQPLYFFPLIYPLVREFSRLTIFNTSNLMGTLEVFLPLDGWSTVEAGNDISIDRTFYGNYTMRFTPDSVTSSYFVFHAEENGQVSPTRTLFFNSTSGIGPTAVGAAYFLPMRENLTINLGGSDPNTPFGQLTAVISKFPDTCSGLDLYGSDGRLLSPQAGNVLVGGTSLTMFLRHDFNLQPFYFRLFDGETYSNEAEVTLNYVNQAPVIPVPAEPFLFVQDENNQIFLPYDTTDTDGPNTVLFTVTRLPDNGTLYQSPGRELRGTPILNPGTPVFNHLVYVSPLGDGEFFDFFALSAFDGVESSDSDAVFPFFVQSRYVAPFAYNRRGYVNPITSVMFELRLTSSSPYVKSSQWFDYYCITAVPHRGKLYIGDSASSEALVTAPMCFPGDDDGQITFLVGNETENHLIDPYTEIHWLVGDGTANSTEASILLYSAWPTYPIARADSYTVLDFAGAPIVLAKDQEFEVDVIGCVAVIQSLPERGHLLLESGEVLVSRCPFEPVQIADCLLPKVTFQPDPFEEGIPDVTEVYAHFSFTVIDGYGRQSDPSNITLYLKPAATANHVFISSDGEDVVTKGSFAEPFRTLEYALAAEVPAIYIIGPEFAHNTTVSPLPLILASSNTTLAGVGFVKVECSGNPGFVVSGPYARLMNLHLIGCSYAGSGTLTINGTNTLLQNFHISNSISAVGPAAIHLLPNVSLLISNVSIIDSMTGGFGTVVIGANSSLSGNNLSIERAEAVKGGCVSMKAGSRMEVWDSSFAECHSGTGGGGAFHLEDAAELLLHDSVISGARANFSDGGAIQMEGGSVARLFGVDLQNCFAKEDGGCMHVGHMSELELYGCSIDGGSSDFHGGIIYGEKSTIIIENTMMEGGVAKRSGGLIYLKRNGTVILRNSSFINMDATQSGGMIYAERESDVLLEKVLMQNVESFAGKGGAIYVGSDSLVRLYEVEVDNTLSASDGALMWLGARSELEAQNLTVRSVPLAPAADIFMEDEVNAVFGALDCLCECPITSDAGQTPCASCTVAVDCETTDCTCSLICENGGTLDEISETCECPPRFTGDLCTLCNGSFDCGVNAHMSDDGSCTCVCDEDWTGAPCLNGNCDCTSCVHDGSCSHGAVFDEATCLCVDCPFPWSGDHCATCKVADACTTVSRPMLSSFNDVGDTVQFYPVVRSLVQDRSCGVIFTAESLDLLGNPSICKIQQNKLHVRQEDVTLQVVLTADALVVPGTELVLSFYGGKVQISTVITAPSEFVAPLVAIIDASPTYAECSELIVSGAASEGNANRPWTTISWTSSNEVLEERLQSLGQDNSLTISIPARFLLPGSYDITLTVENYLGFAAEPTTHMFSINVEAAAELVVIASSTSPLISSEVFVEALVHPVVCDDEDASVAIEAVWEVLGAGGYVLQNHAGLSLYLPGGSFPAAGPYTAMVHVTLIVDGIVQPAVEASQVLQAELDELQAIIVGGQQQQVSEQQSFVLDGSASFDPSSISTDFSFYWQCSAHSACSSLQLPNQPTVELEQLSSGTYQFALQIFDHSTDRYSQISRITLNVVEPPIPDVRISKVSHPLNIGAGFELQGFCRSLTGAPVHFEWVLPKLSGLQSVLRTSLHDEVLAFSSSGNLLGTLPYEFALKCTDTANGISAQSSILLSFNGPPLGGDCKVNPAIGISLVTEFYIGCGGWVDDGNGVLTYQAYYNIGENEYLLDAVPRIESSRRLVLAQEGESDQSEVRVHVCDEQGACSIATVAFTLQQLPVEDTSVLQEVSALTLSKVVEEVNVGVTDEAKNRMQVLTSVLNENPLTDEVSPEDREARAGIRETIFNIVEDVREAEGAQSSGTLLQNTALIVGLLGDGSEASVNTVVRSEALLNELVTEHADEDPLLSDTAQLLIEANNVLFQVGQVAKLFDSVQKSASLYLIGTVCGEELPTLVSESIIVNGRKAEASVFSNSEQTLQFDAVSVDATIPPLDATLNQIPAGACLQQTSILFSSAPFDSSTDRRRLASSVLDYHLSPGSYEEVDGSFRFSIPLLSGIDRSSDIRCVFFDHSKARWSEDGCYRTGFTKNGITCACEHLSSFAALFPDNFSDDDDNAIYYTSAAVAGFMIFLVIVLILLILYTPTFHTLFFGPEGSRVQVSRDAGRRAARGEGLFRERLNRRSSGSQSGSKRRRGRQQRPLAREEI